MPSTAFFAIVEAFKSLDYWCAHMRVAGMATAVVGPPPAPLTRQPG